MKTSFQCLNCFWNKGCRHQYCDKIPPKCTDFITKKDLYEKYKIERKEKCTLSKSKSEQNMAMSVSIQ